MELQYHRSAVGHEEGEAQNTSSPGLLGSGANPLGKGLNMDVGPTGDLQDHIILSSEPSYLGRGLQDGGNIKNSRSGSLDKKPSILGGGPNTDVGPPLIQVTTQYSGSNYWVGHDKYELQSALSSSPLDKEPSLLGGGPNTDVGSSLIRVITQESGKNDSVRYIENELQNIL